MNLKKKIFITEHQADLLKYHFNGTPKNMTFNINIDITSLKDYLTEATAQEIHEKYYPNIPNDIFDQIVGADPISSNLERNKLGEYAKWLLNLYKQNTLKLEDLYKATEYITIFDKLKKSNKLNSEQKDINKYKSLPDMYEVVEPFINNKPISKSEEKRVIKDEGASKVYEDNNWIVIHPHSQAAACEYGKNTQWCTSAKNDNNMFDYYNSSGPLYIIIDKNNNKKYQFHSATDSFMDERDKEVDFNQLPVSNGLRDFVYDKLWRREETKIDFSCMRYLPFKIIQFKNKGETPSDDSVLIGLSHANNFHDYIIEPTYTSYQYLVDGKRIPWYYFTKQEDISFRDGEIPEPMDRIGIVPQSKFTVTDDLLDTGNMIVQTTEDGKNWDNMVLFDDITYKIYEEDYTKFFQKITQIIFLDKKNDVETIFDIASGKVISNEGSLNNKPQLNEGVSSIVYHFTTIDNLVDILEENRMKASKASSDPKDSFEEPLRKGYGKYFISLSRTRTTKLGYGSFFGEVRIEFDGNILNYNHFGAPFNYYNLTSRNVSRKEKRKNIKDFEYEDRLYLRGEYLDNINRYITRIDILTNKATPTINYIRHKCHELNINLNVYTNRNDFDFATPKTIPIEASSNKKAEVYTISPTEYGITKENIENVNYTQRNVKNFNDVIFVHYYTFLPFDADGEGDYKYAFSITGNEQGDFVGDFLSGKLFFVEGVIAIHKMQKLIKYNLTHPDNPYTIIDSNGEVIFSGTSLQTENNISLKIELDKNLLEEIKKTYRDNIISEVDHNIQLYNIKNNVNHSDIFENGNINILLTELNVKNNILGFNAYSPNLITLYDRIFCLENKSIWEYYQKYDYPQFFLPLFEVNNRYLQEENYSIFIKTNTLLINNTPNKLITEESIITNTFMENCSHTSMLNEILMKSYGYYLVENQEEISNFNFEPRKNINIEVNNGDKYYHVTPTVNYINKIEKIGLVPKSQFKGSYHPKVVFLLKDKNQINNMMQELFLKNYRFNSSNYNFDKKYEYSVLEIDLDGLNIKTYKDENKPNAIYTIDNIPPKNIKEMKRYEFVEGKPKELSIGINNDIFNEIINDYQTKVMLTEAKKEDKGHKFYQIGEFVNDIAVVEQDNKYNLIHKNGDLIFPDKWFDDLTTLFDAFKKKGKEYNCLMVSFDNNKDLIKNIKKIQSEINKDDLYIDEEDDIEGLENKHHVTVLYGIHDKEKYTLDYILSLLPKKDRILDNINVSFNNIDIFENEKFDVLKINVTSNTLKNINKILKEKLDYTSKFEGYNAHLTIAYLKKGKGKEYKEKFEKNVDIECTPSEWYYSTANGKKEYKKT
jgi:2'-5' RNA ligase